MSKVPVKTSLPKAKSASRLQKQSKGEIDTASRKLLAAKVFTNLKMQFAKGSEEPELVDGRDNMPLQMSIPLSVDLVDRLVRILPLSINVPRSSFTLNSTNYQLSCDSDVGIWHDSDDAQDVLNRFVLSTPSARSELPFFVLWALSKVLPSVYQMMVGSNFDAPLKVSNQIFKELPEPIPYDSNEPPFEFNYGQVFGKSSIHPTSLVHVFITGATGAGKTYGAVKPLLQSFLHYLSARGKRMGMLVIDPKSELLQVCNEELANTESQERLIRLGNGVKLQFFRQDCELGTEERYRTFASMIQVKAGVDSAVWQEKGNRLNINMALADRQFQLQTGLNLWGVVRSLIEGRDCTLEPQWGNIHAVYKCAVRSRESLFSVACISHVLIQLCPESHRLQTPFEIYTSDAELLNQLFFHVSNAEKVCMDLSAPEVGNIISTDLYPQERKNECNVEELIESGKILILQPRASYFGDLVGRLVKSRFFSDVLTRRDMTTPVGYVADEFQRFITSDRDTGEQSFLDRCRAYRVNCVLATQSLASIEHALCNSGEVSPRLVVDILVANSPTKIIYRSVDSNTQEALRNWIPQPPQGRMHVVDVRPVSQLQVGSAYYMCNGEWGMYRYQRRNNTQ